LQRILKYRCRYNARQGITARRNSYALERSAYNTGKWKGNCSFVIVFPSQQSIMHLVPDDANGVKVRPVVILSQELASTAGKNGFETTRVNLWDIWRF
jgi:hypothetical protein